MENMVNITYLYIQTLQTSVSNHKTAVIREKIIKFSNFFLCFCYANPTQKYNIILCAIYGLRKEAKYFI